MERARPRGGALEAFGVVMPRPAISVHLPGRIACSTPVESGA